MSFTRLRPRSKFSLLLMVVIVLVVFTEKKAPTIGKLGGIINIPGISTLDQNTNEDNIDGQTLMTREQNDLSKKDALNVTLSNATVTLEEKTVQEMKEAKHSEIRTSIKQSEKVSEVDPSRRYLIYIHYDLTGPNVQYGHFREALVSAMFTNRSLMMPYFWPIASHQENLQSEGRTVNETFDMAKLNKMVDLITPEEYNRQCNHSIDVLLVGKKEQPDLWSRVVLHYRNVYDINITFPEGEDLHTLAEDFSSVRCLGILTPNWWRPPPYGDSPNAYKMFVRSVEELDILPEVKKVADQITENLCDGKPYLALNWRNKSGEACAPPRPCKEEQVAYLAELKKTAESGAIAIRKFMEENRLSCLYVAVPFYSKLFLRILKDANVPNIISSDDIEETKYPDLKKYKHDNYYWSLIEQEICLSSKIFLGWRHSSWIDLIRLKRRMAFKQYMDLADVMKPTSKDIIL